MTKQKILEKALLKAHKNGWNPLSTIDWVNVEIEQWNGNGMVGIALLYNHKQSSIHWVRELEGIIYNHDFAKALWGEKTTNYAHTNEYLNTGNRNLLEWQHHLQQMVIADDALKYLEDNI